MFYYGGCQGNADMCPCESRDLVSKENAVEKLIATPYHSKLGGPELARGDLEQCLAERRAGAGFLGRLWHCRRVGQILRPDELDALATETGENEAAATWPARAAVLAALGAVALVAVARRR